jgi:hypothetical protein
LFGESGRLEHPGVEAMGRFKGKVNLSYKAALLLLVGFPQLSACFLFNREDASKNAIDASHSEMGGDVAQGLGSDGSEEGRFDFSTNLVRSSGEVVHLRLKALFPKAFTGSSPFLKETEFETLTSKGLNRSLASESRPTSALAQVALRKWAAPLCDIDTYLDRPGAAPQGALFSNEGILAQGESAPKDGPTRIAWMAARNAWLDLFDENSEEVQELLRVYRAVLAKPGSSEKLALQSICLTAVLSPQFLLGNVGPRDAIRRLALELGRALPRFQDLADFQNGKFTIDEFTKRIQTESPYKEGYREALRSWHRDWWGLREFRTVHSRYTIEQSDPRGVGAYPLSWSEQGSAVMVPRQVFEGRALVEPVGRYTVNYPSNSLLGGCQFLKDGRPNEQAFDPRSEYVIGEHFYKDRDRWEVVGGWVHEDRLSDYQNLIQQYDPSFIARDNCTLMTEQDPKFVAGAPLYYRCKGSVTSSSATSRFLRSSMADFEVQGGTGVDGQRHLWQYRQSYVQKSVPPIPMEPKDGVTHTNVLASSVHSRFTHGGLPGATRRVRRMAPTGWQTGVSQVKTWWSGDTVYVCNDFERFPVTCAGRFPAMRLDSGLPWVGQNTGGFPSPIAEMALRGMSYSAAWGIAPMVLNQYRCGVPDVSQLPNSSTAPIAEDRAYPRGYGFTDEHYLAKRAPEGLNDIALLGEAAGLVAPYENESIARLQRDLLEEPYHLLNHVLDQQLPYGQMVSAPYTVGHEELELAYRSHFFALPDYPPGYTLPAPDAPVRRQLRKIERPKFPPIPISWLRNTLSGNSALRSGAQPYQSVDRNFVSWPELSATVMSSGFIPPAPAAGVLTMPAFLGPVSQKMRTISARVFERLLCGQANLFVPQGSEIALHERYMSHPANPASPAHLDRKEGCYGCHVNLDPLGAALSGIFLRYVQTTPKQERWALSGAFLPVENAQGGTFWIGGRANGEQGEGAFLGKEAKGFQDVGQILADSPQFYRCTTSRAFEKVLGRIPLFQDQAGFERIARDFHQHRNFDRMVRDIIKSRSFQREN